MQKRHIVPHVLVPTDQHTPEAIHPAVRALHNPPPCPEPGFLLQGVGLFPLRSDMGGESDLGEQSTDVRIVIAFVQAHPLRRVWGRLRPLDGNALDGLPCQLEVMAVGALHCEADRHAAAVGEYTALGAGFATVGGVLAHLFPPQAGLWSSPRSWLTPPSQCRARRRRRQGPSSTTSKRPQPRSILESDDGRNY
jgi:hypothetical protein